MATIATTARRRTTTGSRIGVRVPVWAAVVFSRLVVLGAGIAGALFTHRIPGWTAFDPHRLSSSLGSVGNVLAAPVFRWDGIRYVSIAEHGYTTAAQTVSYPLYSLVIRAVTLVVPSPVVAGVLISLGSFAIALVLLHRITSEELGTEVASATVLLLAFAPLSFFFSAVYTESLLLALLVGTFYLARKERFALAGLTATAAALTHVEGVLLVAPLAYMYWRSRGQSFDWHRLWSSSVVSFALPPLAVAGFFVYLHAHGYGWLAPVTNGNYANYGRETLTTPVMLWQSFYDGLVGLSQTLHGVPPINPTVAEPYNVGFQNLVYLTVLAIALASLVAVWRRLPREYAIFATLVMLVCTWTGVVGRPLEAFDRYMLPIFPLWMGAAAWLHERRLTRPVLQISTVLLIFYTVMFARWVFIA